MADREDRIIDLPSVRADFALAPAELLRALDRFAYPLLRSDPANASGQHPITWAPPWFELDLRIPGGPALLAYQVLEDERLVMTARLLWAPGSQTG
jgi:hypothetical protein